MFTRVCSSMWLCWTCQSVVLLVLLSLLLADGYAASCVSPRLIQRHRLNPELYGDCLALRQKRRIDATFHGNPKPRADLLASKFLGSYNPEQANSLVGLVNKIAKEYLGKCPPVIYYDYRVAKANGQLLETLFKVRSCNLIYIYRLYIIYIFSQTIPITFYHGSINERYEPQNRNFNKHIDNNCKSYILFLSDPLMARKILGPQTDSRVVLVSSSSQWKLRDFLSSEISSNIVNLLVIGESLMASPQQVRVCMCVKGRGKRM